MAFLVTAPVSAGAQIVMEMTPDRIREAIAAGGDSCYGLTRGRKNQAMSVFIGCYSTPYSRVAGAAKKAKAAYRPFTEADVTPEMIAPEVWIAARPQQPRHHPGMVDVVAVVVAPAKSTDTGAAIQPVRSIEDTATYQNMMGATFQGKGMMAVFPLSILSEENEVRVVYDSPVCTEGSFSGFLKDKKTAECAVRFKLDKIR
jgi:hypothetical protein